MQSAYTGCSQNYVDALVSSGSSPLLLPCAADLEVLASVLPVCSGLVLSGGGDICSHYFGEEPHPACSFQDDCRDQMELELTRAAISRGLPILAICRGIQVLNVACSGTLVQDIPTQIVNPLQHFTDGFTDVLGHTIQIQPGTLLARILGTSKTRVNSYHHQSLLKIGDGLRVSAVAKDGVVEAVEAVDGAPILGVQFHPEISVNHQPLFASLFDWLVDEANRYRHSQI